MVSDERPGRLRRDATYFVTGAAKNLGRACVLALAAGGAERIVLHVHSDLDAANEVAALCEGYGSKTLVVSGDIAKPDDVAEMVGAAAGRFGGIDAYVANAAIRPLQSFAETTPSEWERVLDVDLNSAFLLAKAITPGMIEKGWGRIIHTSGFTAFHPGRAQAHMITARSGLHGLTKALAFEYGPVGLTVNTVVPGAFDTLRDPVHYPDWDPVKQAERIPVRRLGQPDDYGALCSFLLSEDAGFITGQVIHLSGGLYMN